MQWVVLIESPRFCAFSTTCWSKDQGWNQAFLTFFSETWSRICNEILGLTIKTTISGVSLRVVRLGAVFTPSISGYFGLIGKKVWFRLMIRRWSLSARESSRGDAQISAIFSIIWNKNEIKIRFYLYFPMILSINPYASASSGDIHLFLSISARHFS